MTSWRRCFVAHHCFSQDRSPSFLVVFQVIARVWAQLQWGITLFSKENNLCVSHVRLLAIPWTVAHQAPPSMGFSSKSTGVGWFFLSLSLSLFFFFFLLISGSFHWNTPTVKICVLYIFCEMSYLFEQYTVTDFQSLMTCKNGNCIFSTLLLIKRASRSR